MFIAHRRVRSSPPISDVGSAAASTSVSFCPAPRAGQRIVGKRDALDAELAEVVFELIPRRFCCSGNVASSAWVRALIISRALDCLLDELSTLSRKSSLTLSSKALVRPVRDSIPRTLPSEQARIKSFSRPQCNSLRARLPSIGQFVTTIVFGVRVASFRRVCST
ncbi:hypothetical protein PHSY_006506 [Pseudozyma hubeiensis SY62]|uniref:Uncharacterized protein n=1 Tax=Pseudozyma hubeiensis (strain SY62) TaxID=1305764 RepID=R9PC17_PSEHS|nr:hypothetical protein PHSY_006506 [Pseudozyma hubeiensis SY62]GAC98911.1 hypothetical protein PHSY_006506 [Pseudozyma hubeiensis SY62]